MANGPTDRVEPAGGPPSIPRPDVPVGGLPRARLDRVTAYIENNLHRELRLTELGAVARMSPYHFARLFKTATGVSPHRFVVLRRIDAAAAMLTSSTSSIGAIGRAVGFRTPSQFATIFRRMTGLTPTAYRAGRALRPSRADVSRAETSTATPTAQTRRPA